jgi:molybdopterin converting factor small subunit
VQDARIAVGERARFKKPFLNRYAIYLDMKVTVRLYGFMALKHGGHFDLDLEEGLSWGETIEHVFRTLNLGHITIYEGKLIATPGYLLIYLNGKECVPEIRLKEGDTVSIYPPVVGG